MIKYLTEYKWCSAAYEYYKKLEQPDIPPEKLEKYFQKTIELIHELTEISEFRKKVGPTVVDLNYIKSLKESNLTEEQKTIGSAYALRYICTLRQKNPVYKSIVERVKEIIRKWEENEIDIIALGSELEEILNYIEEKEKEKKMTNLNEIEFGIKLALENNKKINKEDVEKMAKQIYERIKNNLFPDWNKNPAISKEVSRRIREYLTEIRQIYGLSYEEFNKLHQEIFDFIVNL
jgi:type I site-specific restriction-modification system R (restriction) subunit